MRGRKNFLDDILGFLEYTLFQVLSDAMPNSKVIARHVGPYGKDPGTHSEVVEVEDEFIITVELPGVDSEDIVISAGRDCIRVVVDEEDDSELRYGGIDEDFELPARIDASRVKATCRNGVLEMRAVKSKSGGMFRIL